MKWIKYKVHDYSLINHVPFEGIYNNNGNPELFDTRNFNESENIKLMNVAIFKIKHYPNSSVGKIFVTITQRENNGEHLIFNKEFEGVLSCDATIDNALFKLSSIVENSFGVTDLIKTLNSMSLEDLL